MLLTAIATLATSSSGRFLAAPAPGPAAKPKGEVFELQSATWNATATVVREGGNVAIRFRVNEPLQADDHRVFVQFTFTRPADRHYSVSYLPACFDRNGTRVQAWRTVGNEWKDNKEFAQYVTSTVDAQSTEYWEAVIWVDLHSMGGVFTESWDVAFRIGAAERSASCPEDIDTGGRKQLKLQNLPLVEAAGNHTAKTASQREARVKKAVEDTTALADPDARAKVLLKALEADPGDPLLHSYLLGTYRLAPGGTLSGLTHRAAVELVLREAPGWYAAHSTLMWVMTLQDDHKSALAYYTKMSAKLPMLALESCAEMHAEGIRLMGLLGLWSEAADIARKCTGDAREVIARALELAIRSEVYESRIEAGEKLLVLLEGLLQRMDDPRLDDLVVWWVEVLGVSGDFKRTLKYARTLFGEVEEEDEALRVARACLRAVGKFADPPEAAKEVEALLVDVGETVSDSIRKQLKDYVDACKANEEAWNQELAYRAEDAKKKNPRVEMQTDRGKIVLELFEDDAPNTVANFVDLIRSRFYDGRMFYRVEPAWIIQGGSPDNTITGQRDWSIKNEANRRGHWPGTIAMARTNDVNGADTHFFITTGNSEHGMKLQKEWVVFGRVVEGLEVAQKTAEGDILLKVTVTSLRDHDYIPVRTERSD
jgi:peptidyl-prolyl cis-trans isomerase B (cyclophilin B)